MPARYVVTIYWSAEDEAFIAEVPELPGCMTHGETIAEAAANAEEAIEAWLDAATEAGRDIPEPIVERHYSGRFVTRLPRDLHARIALEAQRQGVSLNQFVLSRLAGGPPSSPG